MKIIIGVLLALFSILLGSPLIALVIGSLLVLVFKFPSDYISKSVTTNLLQVGIILIGLTISASTIYLKAKSDKHRTFLTPINLFCFINYSHNMTTKFINYIVLNELYL